MGFPGSFSSLLFWKRGLTSNETSSVYDFYKDELTQANDDKMVLYNPQMTLFMTSQRNFMQMCTPFRLVDPLDTLVRVEKLYKVAQTCPIPTIPKKKKKNPCVFTPPFFKKKKKKKKKK